MSRTVTIEIPNKEALSQAAEKFVDLMGDYTVFAFDGQMGAGKTTFISALTQALGVEDDVANSPSFAIVNEYRSDTTAELMYHFDMYRLNDMSEAMDIGMDDYLDSGALCFIEWPDRVDPMLPDDTVRVHITVDPDTDARRLTVELPDD